MKIQIEFQDRNHNTIAVHYIEYDTITPPYLGIVKYCHYIMDVYKEVFFYYLS